MSITLDQVTKHYAGAPVVNDVRSTSVTGSFSCCSGRGQRQEHAAARHRRLSGVDHGRIALHGRDVHARRRPQARVGLVFQNYALVRIYGGGEHRVRHCACGTLGASAPAARQELLRLVSLGGMDQRLPAQLSGGQQQRVRWRARWRTSRGAAAR